MLIMLKTMLIVEVNESWMNELSLITFLHNLFFKISVG